MSSDEEELPSHYEDYQRLIEDGIPIPRLPSKGKEKVSNHGVNDDSMDWETITNPAPKTILTAKNEDEDDDDTVVYSDPDDRVLTPLPSFRNTREHVRRFAAQNPRYSSSRYGPPLRTSNVRERNRSPTKHRGRYFGARAYAPHRPSQYNRSPFRLPPRPPSPRLVPPPVQQHARQQTAPPIYPVAPDSETPDINYDQPYQQRRPARPPPFARRIWLQPWDIKLTDHSHLVPEREDLQWSNRRHEKGAGRFSRKRKALAFFDTFEGTFSLVPQLRFADQAPSGNQHSSDEDEEAVVDDVPHGIGLDRIEIDDDGPIDIEPDIDLHTSPTPDLPVRRNFQARKAIEISDDSEPESVRNSDKSPSDTDSFDEPGVEEHEPPLAIVISPPEPILQAIKAASSRTLPRLPFLRRNLKLSFYDAFIRHIATTPRLALRLPNNTSSQPSVSWEYQVDAGSNSWEVIQDGWTCQLCTFFPPFVLGSALMYHLWRDHPTVSVGRSKTGFKKWKVLINLDGPKISSLIPTPHEPSPLSEPTILSLDETPTVTMLDEIQPPPAIVMDSETSTQARHYRVGGRKCYDIAMQEVPIPLQGLAAKAFENRENDMCFFTKCSDKEKAMAIIWGRWVCQNRLNFIKQPLRNAMSFIDVNWDIIRRTAELEGLIRWLLVRGCYEVSQVLYAKGGRYPFQEVPTTSPVKDHRSTGTGFFDWLRHGQLK